jgi:NAD(P)-dependent dehydrogenase (short-subunit alcohol dehydrogenase family)
MAESKPQRVFLTGGCGDIGRAVAKRFLAGGAQVMLADLHSESDGAAIARQMHATNAFYVRCDVTKHESVKTAVADTVETLGGIDVSISNAGKSYNGRILEQSEEDWRKNVECFLNASFLVAKETGKAILRNTPSPTGRRGSILFTGSWVQAMPFPTSGAYCAAKAGQEMLMKVLAQELADEGVTCNCVAPGMVDAGLTKVAYEKNEKFRKLIPTLVPMRRMSSAEELAGAFYFLAGPEADYITGTTLLIDGGASLVYREL